MGQSAATSKRGKRKYKTIRTCEASHEMAAAKGCIFAGEAGTIDSLPADYATETTTRSPVHTSASARAWNSVSAAPPQLQGKEGGTAAFKPI
jgi:hypothetical protein